MGSWGGPRVADLLDALPHEAPAPQGAVAVDIAGGFVEFIADRGPECLFENPPALVVAAGVVLRRPGDAALEERGVDFWRLLHEPGHGIMSIAGRSRRPVSRGFGGCLVVWRVVA